MNDTTQREAIELLEIGKIASRIARIANGTAQAKLEGRANPDSLEKILEVSRGLIASLRTIGLDPIKVIERDYTSHYKNPVHGERIQLLDSLRMASEAFNKELIVAIDNVSKVELRDKTNTRLRHLISDIAVAYGQGVLVGVLQQSNFIQKANGEEFQAQEIKQTINGARITNTVKSDFERLSETRLRVNSEDELRQALEADVDPIAEKGRQDREFQKNFKGDGTGGFYSGTLDEFQKEFAEFIHPDKKECKSEPCCGDESCKDASAEKGQNDFNARLEERISVLRNAIEKACGKIEAKKQEAQAPKTPSIEHMKSMLVGYHIIRDHEIDSYPEDTISGLFNELCESLAKSTQEVKDAKLKSELKAGTDVRSNMYKVVMVSKETGMPVLDILKLPRKTIDAMHDACLEAEVKDPKPVKSPTPVSPDKGGKSHEQLKMEENAITQMTEMIRNAGHRYEDFKLTIQYDEKDKTKFRVVAEQI